MPKMLKDLTAQEVLALAIQSEEEDGRIYADLAERVGKEYPETAQSLKAMHDEENGHRHRLIELYRKQFGEHIPLIRRQDVKGFITRKPLVDELYPDRADDTQRDRNDGAGGAKFL